MAAVRSTGEGCLVVAKHTFWDLEDEEEMEETTVQRPRALTDSALLGSIYTDDDATDDDDGNCMHNESLSSAETDTGSSVDEIPSHQSSFLWSDCDEEETSAVAHPPESLLRDIRSGPSSPLWSDCAEKETNRGGHPPGTFCCQMPSVQWVHVAVQLPGKSAEADMNGCRAETKPRHSKVSNDSEPSKAKQTVLRALKKARQTVQSAQ